MKLLTTLPSQTPTPHDGSPVVLAGRRVRVPVSDQHLASRVSHQIARLVRRRVLIAGASVGGASAFGSTRREEFTARTPIPYPLLSWLANRLPTADASGVVMAIRGGHDAAVGRQQHVSTGTASSHEWKG